MTQQHEIEKVQHHNLFFGNSPVRIVEDEHGQPWWVAKDVCEILGIKNPSQAMNQLDDDERMIQNIGYSGVGNPNVNVISESGIYSLILRSNKPQAKPFRKWVTSEVLPTIRRTGSYTHPAAQIADPAQASLVLTLTENTSKMFELMAKTLERFDARLDRLEQTETAAPRQLPLPRLGKLQANGVADILAFVTAACRIIPDGTVDKALFYQRYRNWCLRTNKHPYDYGNFCKGLYQAGLPIRASHRKTGQPGHTLRLVLGLRLLSAALEVAA